MVRLQCLVCIICLSGLSLPLFCHHVQDSVLKTIPHSFADYNAQQHMQEKLCERASYSLIVFTKMMFVCMHCKIISEWSEAGSYCVCVCVCVLCDGEETQGREIRRKRVIQ